MHIKIFPRHGLALFSAFLLLFLHHFLLLPQNRHEAGFSIEVPPSFSPINRFAKISGYSFRQFHTHLDPVFKMSADILGRTRKKKSCWHARFLFASPTASPKQKRFIFVLNSCMEYLYWSYGSSWRLFCLCPQVALVNVVHIKDSVCTLPTSILAQYLKQANGQLSCLKVSAASCVVRFGWLLVQHPEKSNLKTRGLLSN